MSSKFKANIIVNDIKIKCSIEITNHFLKIAITDKNGEIDSKFELIKALFISVNHSKTNEYFLNYAFINNIKGSKQKNNSIILEINNPVSSNIFSFILIDIEGISFLFKKKMDINQIIVIIKKKIKEEIKYLISGFNNMIFTLRDYLEKTKKIKNLEIIKEQAYKYGKKYYENAAITFKKNNDIAKTINDNILLLKLKSLEQSLSQQAKMKKNISYTSFESLISEINIRTSYFIEETIIFFLKIICLGINSFDDLNFNKFNLNQIFENNNAININKNQNNKSFTYGNNNKNIINKEEDIFNKISKKNNKNNENQIDDGSTEGTSKKKKTKKKIYISQDDTKIQTPKFKQFNYNYRANNHQGLDNFSNNYYNNLNNNKIQISINPLENINNLTKDITNKKLVTLNSIKKEIDELCNIHSLLTPDNIFNLFCNASEIIHRKFFQLFIENYLGKIFYLEEDKEGNIKIEDLYNYFLYIRSLKLMLFNNDKKDYFMNNILIENIII